MGLALSCARRDGPTQEGPGSREESREATAVGGQHARRRTRASIESACRVQPGPSLHSGVRKLTRVSPYTASRTTFHGDSTASVSRFADSNTNKPPAANKPYCFVVQSSDASGSP